MKRKIIQVNLTLKVGKSATLYQNTYITENVLQQHQIDKIEKIKQLLPTEIQLFFVDPYGVQKLKIIKFSLPSLLLSLHLYFLLIKIAIILSSSSITVCRSLPLMTIYRR